MRPLVPEQSGRSRPELIISASSTAEGNMISPSWRIDRISFTAEQGIVPLLG